MSAIILDGIACTGTSLDDRQLLDESREERYGGGQTINSQDLQIPLALAGSVMRG
jgi:hypothetical protein